MCTDMAKLILEKKLGDHEKNLSKNLKKYRIKISMIKPYHCIDFWAKKPDVNNALEVFIDELFTLNPSEYFKIEVSES
jgi:hypothetical protein